ncbi:hypothetical protein SNEBB_009552 [Seison nebaliae]|nr:hypothetical protein SNEBB_009552 [Seison nebaliae]
MTLKIIKGDLFSSTAPTALAHCVSVDLRMGKGIAVMFQKMFGGVNELKEQKPEVGGCCFLKRDNRYVYYLITKQFYYNKPTYVDFTKSLERMRDIAVGHGVTQIAMPKIGCGLDGLEWTKVEDILKNIFHQQTAIEAIVYLK